MLIAVFAAVVGSILVSALAVQHSSREVDLLTDSILGKVTPSIEHLAALRGSTLEVELILSQYVEPGAHASDEQLGRALNRLSDEVQLYLHLPDLPGEQAHQNAMQQAWARFDESARRTQELAAAGNTAEAEGAVTRIVEPAAGRLLDAALRAIEFNALHGRELASRIKEIRLHTLWLSGGMTAFSVALGIVGALLLHRQARTRRAMAQQYAHFLEERAAELEQFAGRVAHDIRNPLSTAQMGAELILQGVAPERAQAVAHRIARSLSRANAITSDLLDFARSGARPDPGARCDPRDVLNDLVAGLAEEAEELRIDLQVERPPPVLVACSVGVYLSLTSNLVRNALKYMGSSPVRRVTVRVVDQGSSVKTEVIDTGPGISEAHCRSLFTPYFRAQPSARDGIGIGLATVKKLAEGHFGRAGASSVVGRGSTFWFELPHAGAARPATKNEDSIGTLVRAVEH